MSIQGNQFKNQNLIKINLITHLLKYHLHRIANFKINDCFENFMNL